MAAFETRSFFVLAFLFFGRFVLSVCFRTAAGGVLTALVKQSCVVASPRTRPRALDIGGVFTEAKLSSFVLFFFLACILFDSEVAEHYKYGFKIGESEGAPN